MLNSVRMAAWVPPAVDGIWEALAFVQPLHEPAFACPVGLEPAAGVMVVEPDGRVWLAQPTNACGGVAHVVPKGSVDVGSTLIATAPRGAREELGLLVKLTSHLVDLARSATFTRYYLGNCVAGSVADVGWESQASVLAPLAALRIMPTRPGNQAVLDAFETTRG